MSHVEGRRLTEDLADPLGGGEEGEGIGEDVDREGRAECDECASLIFSVHFSVARERLLLVMVMTALMKSVPSSPRKSAPIRANAVLQYVSWVRRGRRAEGWSKEREFDKWGRR